MPPKKTKKKRSSFEEAIKKGLTKEEYEQQEFDIKDIVGMRFLKKEVRFHVKWEGYTTDDDSWEPIESFLNSPEAFNAFRDKLLVEPPAPPVGNQDNHPVKEKTKRSNGRPSLKEAYMNGLTLEEFNRKNFEIERISKVRIFEGVPEFRVQWRGYGNCYDTWEPVNCFGYAPQALKIFLNMMLPPALPIPTTPVIVDESDLEVSPEVGIDGMEVDEEIMPIASEDPVRKAVIEVVTPDGVNGQAAAEEMHGEGTQKRGRGRPRKRAASLQENKENQLIIPKRARGRPRKNAQSIIFSETKTENTSLPTEAAGPQKVQVHMATVAGIDIAGPSNQNENVAMKTQPLMNPEHESNVKFSEALMEAAEKHRPKKFRNAFAFQEHKAAFDTNPMLDSGSSSSPSSSRRKNTTEAMEATSSEPSSSRMQSNSIPPPMDTGGPSQIRAHVTPVARDDITEPENQKEHVDAEHSRSAEPSPVPRIHPRGYSALVMSLPMKFTNIGSLQDCSRTKNNTDVKPTTSGPSTDRGTPEVPEPIMLRMPDNAMNANGMPTDKKVNRRTASVRNQLNEELIRARLEKIEHIEEIESGFVTGALHKNQFDVPKMKPAADRSEKDNFNSLKKKRHSRKEGTRTVKQCPNKCRPRSTRMCKMCKIEEKYWQELAYCSDIESGGEDLFNEKFVGFEDKENDVILKQDSKKEDKGHEIVFASWDKETHEAEYGYDADEDTDTELCLVPIERMAKEIKHTKMSPSRRAENSDVVLDKNSSRLPPLPVPLIPPPLEVPLSQETKLKMITPSPPAENSEGVLEKKPLRLPPLAVPPIPPRRVYLDDRRSVKEEKPIGEGRMAGIEEKIQKREEKPVDPKFDEDSVSDEMEVFIIDDEQEEGDHVPETTKKEFKHEESSREQKMRDDYMPKYDSDETDQRCEEVPNHDAHEAEEDEDQLVGEQGVFENDPHRVEDTAGNEGQESEEEEKEEVFEEFPGYKKERSPEPSMQWILNHLDEQKLAETLLMNELKQIEAMPWGRDRCNFCGEHWASELCDKYPTHNKRLGFVRKYHACHSCGSTKHRVTGCERLLACVYCKKSAHHLQMCSIFSTDFVKDYYREPHPKGPLNLKVPSKGFGSKKRSRRRKAQKA